MKRSSENNCNIDISIYEYIQCYVTYVCAHILHTHVFEISFLVYVSQFSKVDQKIENYLTVTKILREAQAGNRPTVFA